MTAPAEPDMAALQRALEEATDPSVLTFIAQYEIHALLSHIDTLTSRLAEETAGRGWQPIETAPKDGSPFLAANQKAQALLVWRDNRFDGWAYWEAPTRWQPLPPPPTPEASHD